MKLDPAELEQLVIARSLLENPRLATKLMDWLGGPIEKGYAHLPEGWQEKVNGVSTAAINAAMQAALHTLDDKPGLRSSRLVHKLLVACSGAVGGAFGLSALLVELPFSTTLMLRSIADIAREQEQSLARLETRLSCLQVFALGGTSSSDDGAETGYFAVRAGLNAAVTQASRHLAKKGLTNEGAPAVVRLITRIAARFSIPVSEKIAAQAVPVIGAAGGALINTMFTDHFQNMAQGHFTVIRLEQKYGMELVRTTYDQLGDS